MHCLEHFWDIVYILCLSVLRLSVCLHNCQSVYLSIRLFVCLSICLFVCISLCPFVDLFVRQKVCLLVFWVFVCQKICIFVSCLSAFCLFVCLLVFPGLCLSENMQICLLSVSFLSLWLSVLSVYLSACLSVCLIPLSVWSLCLPVCLFDPSVSLWVCVLLAGENWCDVSRSLVWGVGGGGLSPALLIADGNWSRNLVLIKSREKEIERGRGLRANGDKKNRSGVNSSTGCLLKGWLVLVLSPYFKRLWSPGIQGMNSASLCSLPGRYDNPIPPRFLAPIHRHFKNSSSGLFFHRETSTNVIPTSIPTYLSPASISWYAHWAI